MAHLFSTHSKFGDRVGGRLVMDSSARRQGWVEQVQGNAVVGSGVVARNVGLCGW